jgi:hypothetical protein
MPQTTVSDPDPEISSALQNLYYQDEAKWVLLPNWAKFFLQLGNQLSQFEFPDVRFTVVLSVPARAFASTFIAAGIICGRSCLPRIDNDLSYFEKLWFLPSGTCVFYRDGKRKLKARKTGNLDTNLGKFIGIQIDQGKTNTVLSISPDKARRIEISKREFSSLPGAQGGWQLPPPKLLIKKILGDRVGSDLVLQSSLDCVIIGPHNKLKQEVKSSLSPINTPPDESPGTLADLLRVKDFQPQGQAYRSSAIPGVSRKSSIKAAIELSPFVVIFDGSQGFTKWKDYWDKFNMIIVLERTDLNFDYAASQINSDYYNRSTKKIKVAFPHIPPSIEMMFFIRDL